MALTKIPASLLNTSSGITLGDNEKALFGAGSDLQIYHDSSLGHSIITDVGTGNLLIRGTNLNLQDASGYNFIVMEDLGNGGVVKLRHNDVTKLETTSTGATVTGNLAVTGDLDITGNVNSASVTDLDVTDKTITLGAGQTEALSGGSGIIIDGSSASILWDETNTSWDFNESVEIAAGKNIRVNTVNNVGNTANIIYRSSTNTIVGNNASALVVQDGGNVGVGTSNPNTKLHVNSTSQGNFVEGIRLENSGGGANEGAYIQWEIANSSGYGPRIGGRREGTGGMGLHFYTGEINAAPTEKMRINHDGKVGISTTASLSGSDYGMLTIKKTGSNIFGDSAITINSADTNQSTLALGLTGSVAYIDSTESGSGSVLPLVFATASAEKMRIDSAGNVAIGHTTTTGSKFAICDGANSQIQFFPEISTDTNLTQHYDPTAAAYINAETRAASHSWKIGTSEAMSIDSSGTLLVGTSDGSGAGLEISKIHGVRSTVTNNVAALFDRLSSDGEIALFRHDSSTDGQINTLSGRIAIGSGNTGLFFDSIREVLTPHTMTGNTYSANIDLGRTAIPFKDLHLSGGIQFDSRANYLDDYEEGTWTPTFVGATLAAAEGWYTKIGNQVTVHFYLVTTGGLPSSGTQVRVGALPYTVTSSFAGAGSLYVGPSNVSSATGGGGTIVTMVSGGEAFIRFVNVDTGVLGYTVMGELEVSANNSITALGTMTYQA